MSRKVVLHLDYVAEMAIPFSVDSANQICWNYRSIFDLFATLVLVHFSSVFQYYENWPLHYFDENAL